jgi:hypothetical protein
MKGEIFFKKRIPEILTKKKKYSTTNDGVLYSSIYVCDVIVIIIYKTNLILIISNI